jgi:MFS transporter, UMF1 family
MKQSIWKRLNKADWSWATFDWANSAFSTTVMTALFPIFYKSYWSAGTDVSTSTAQLGLTHSVVSGVLALLSPVLGAFADRGSKKKAFLFFFTFLGVLGTCLMPMVAQGDWISAVVLFLVANLGFSGGMTFYDSLLCSISKPKDMEFKSALGYALGYLGGGLLFLLNIIMVMKPEMFGLADKAEATKMSFLSVGIWWAVFAIPIFLFVPENNPDDPVPPKMPAKQIIKEGFAQLYQTFKELRKHHYLGVFLLSYFFYIDGVNTIIKMAVDYGMSIGIKQDALILAILLVQFVGFPATLLFGAFVEKIGAKTSLLICIGVYTIVTVFAFQMTTEWEFYTLAIVISFVQGPIQSCSRAVFGRMIPSEQSGEFFGFYNMLGKFSAVLGPVLVASVSLVTKDPRYSILSVVILLVIGAFFLLKVPIAEAKK